MLRIKDLKCEYKKNPIGIDAVNPRLSWIIISDKKNIMQKAYQIQVCKTNTFDDLVWDTQKAESDQSIHIKYQGPALCSGLRYYYRVRIWIYDKISDWSETAFWEMGLLNKSDWEAQWITPDTKPSTCPLMRNTFNIQKEIKSARVYVTGVGLYELRLNGKKVGHDFLTPGWTSYNNRTQYQTYDVTDLLQKNNAVGIILGDGWYKGHITWHSKINTYGDEHAAIVQINIKYKDNSTEYITSDMDWKSADSPILFSDIYNGETSFSHLEKNVAQSIL